MSGYKSRGDPVTVQENPQCPCDRIVTPVLAVTIASMRVTTPCNGIALTQHLTSRMSNRAIKKPTYSVAYDHQKYCGDFSETTAFKSYGVKHKRKSQYMLIRSGYILRLTAIGLMYSEGNFSAAKHQRLLREGVRTAPVKAVALPAV